MATAILRLLWKPDFPIKEDYLLTFDDGPSKLSKDLLETLRKNDKDAIFFLLGEKLKSYDLAIYHGYQIGCHGYRHVNFALMTPFRTYKEFNKALAAFKEVGLAPSYFRAPYGLYNLTLLILIKTHGMKPFQWDFLLGDWKKEDDFVLLNKLKDKARDKNVLVLHDGTEGSADPGAKDKMLKEVRIFLDEERENKKSHN